MAGPSVSTSFDGRRGRKKDRVKRWEAVSDPGVFCCCFFLQAHLLPIRVGRVRDRVQERQVDVPGDAKSVRPMRNRLPREVCLSEKRTSGRAPRRRRRQPGCRRWRRRAWRRTCPRWSPPRTSGPAESCTCPQSSARTPASSVRSREGKEAIFPAPALPSCVMMGIVTHHRDEGRDGQYYPNVLAANVLGRRRAQHRQIDQPVGGDGAQEAGPVGNVGLLLGDVLGMDSVSTGKGQKGPNA